MKQHDLIDRATRPDLATAGQRAAPDNGADRSEQQASIEGILREQWSVMGVVDSAKKAADLGKKAADKLTDDGKRIEDRATHEEKDARDEAHRKIARDKGNREGRASAEPWHGDAAPAFAAGLEASI